MANDFSGDPSCVALWRFESGALTTDSIGTNTLTNNGVSEDTTNYMEGSCSAYFNNTISDWDYFYIEDADLDSNFPFKKGDTTKVCSASLRFRYDATGYNQYLIANFYGTAETKRFVVLVSSTNELRVFHGYNNSGNIESFGTGLSLVDGQEYVIGVAHDGVNKTLLVRVWDETAATAYTYTKSWSNETYVSTSTDGRFYIGGMAVSYDSAVKGNLDEIVIFNELKTADDFDAIRTGTYGYESGGTSANADLTVMFVELGANDAEFNELYDISADANIEVMLAEVSSNVFDTVAYADLTAMLCDIEAYEGTRADLKVMLCEVSGVGLQGSIAYADLAVMLADVDGVLSSETVESGAYDTTATADLTVMLCGISGTGLTGTICNTDIELPFITLDADSSYESTIAYADLEVMLCKLDAYVAEAIIITGWDGTTESVTGYALVLNLRNNALTEYDNYDFNSFAYFNGKYLAANSMGIFELTGDDDIGTDIDATIRTGLQDGGTSLRKGIVDAFFGVSCDDELSAKVITDGYNSYAGSGIAPRDTDLVTQRVKFGKGVRSRFLGVEVSNTDGCDFNLESAEFTVVPLTRQM